MATKQDADNTVTEFPGTEGNATPDYRDRDIALHSRRTAYEIQQAELRKTMSIASVLGIIFLTLFWVSFQNPQIYVVKNETLTVINQGYNAAILLTIPFLFGVMGAVSRLLLSGV